MIELDLIKNVLITPLFLFIQTFHIILLFDLLFGIIFYEKVKDKLNVLIPVTTIFGLVIWIVFI